MKGFKEYYLLIEYTKDYLGKMTTTFSTILNPAQCNHSIFANKRMREYVNKDVMQSFIQNGMGISYRRQSSKRYKHISMKYETEQTQIAAFLGCYNDTGDYIEVSHYLVQHKWGRIEPTNYLSLSKFHRPTRHAFAKDRYIDIDMQNAHPHLFSQICQANNLNSKYITDYAANPKFYREKLMDIYGVSKDVAKNLPITLCFGGSIADWRFNHSIPNEMPDVLEMVELEKELALLMPIILASNPDIANGLIAYKPDKYSDPKKLLRSVMSLWSQTVERICQETAVEWLIDHKQFVLEDIVPCQDGIMILKELWYDGILADMSYSIKQKLDLDISWLNKPFDEAITIPPFDILKMKPRQIEDIYNYDNLVFEVQDTTFAKLVFYMTEYSIIMQGDLFYIYFKNEWRSEPKKDGELVKHIITNTLTNYLKVVHLLIAKREAETTIGTPERADCQNRRCSLYKLERSLTMSKSVKDIFAQLKGILSSKFHKYTFNNGENNDYLVHFKNGVYDTKAKLFRQRNRFDYTTKYLDYDYIPRNKIANEKYEFVLDFFKKIQPEQTQRDFTLSYLAYGLTGNASKQIFKMNIGYEGSNGKSTEAALHEKCFPIYTSKIAKEILEKGYSKRHKFIIQLYSEPIRLVYFEEIPTKKLDTDFVKDWVDGRQMDIEVMFGTVVKMRIVSKLLTNSNHDPHFDTDGGLNRRGIIQNYTSRFVESNPDEANHIYLKDDTFLDIFEDNEYKNAYFHLLLNYIDEVKTPQENRDLFKEIVSSGDVVLCEIEKLVDITKCMTDKVHVDRVKEIFPMIGYKDLSNKLKQLGCIYKKDCVVNGLKGVWCGLTVKAPPQSDTDTEDNDDSR